MAKSIVVTLEGDIPETEVGKNATVTVDGNNYAGKVVAVIAHTEVATGTVTLEGAGLKTISP